MFLSLRIGSLFSFPLYLSRLIISLTVIYCANDADLLVDIWDWVTKDAVVSMLFANFNAQSLELLVDIWGWVTKDAVVSMLFARTLML